MTATNWIMLAGLLLTALLIPTALWMVRVAGDLRELRVRLDLFFSRFEGLDVRQQELAADHKTLAGRVDRHEVRIATLEAAP